jgi:hypothetical protein
METSTLKTLGLFWTAFDRESKVTKGKINEMAFA